MKWQEAVEKLHLDPGTVIDPRMLMRRPVIPEALVGNPCFLRELGYPPFRLGGSDESDAGMTDFFYERSVFQQPGKKLS